MTPLQRLFAIAGVHEYTWKWCGDDFAEVWESWEEPHDMVQLLLGIGFPEARVAKRLDAVRALHPSFALPGENVYNAAALLARVLPRKMLCDVLRTEFSLAEVAEKLLQFAGGDRVEKGVEGGAGAPDAGGGSEGAQAGAGN